MQVVETISDIIEEAKRKRKFFNKVDRTLPTKWVGSTLEGEGGQPQFWLIQSETKMLRVLKPYNGRTEYNTREKQCHSNYIFTEACAIFSISQSRGSKESITL